MSEPRADPVSALPAVDPWTRIEHRNDPVLTCPSVDTWQSFLEGRFCEDERGVLENHFDVCSHCAAVVTRLAGWGEGAGVPGWTQPGPSEDLLLSLVHRPSPFAAPPAVPRPVELPVLPGFRGLAEVGRGASGIVYRAVQESLERVVAIKVLSAEALARGRHRIEREARALARLRHPHIVAIHEFGFTGQVPFLVMEWLRGGSLQARIERGPLAVGEAARLMRQLADAVAAVHALGIVHRDLKPANVLLAEADPGVGLSVRLTDFGLAQDHSQSADSTLSGTAVGTPAYMAPEQTGLVDGPGATTAACDIYGVGAIAYACLTGRPPHLGRSTLETLVRVASNEPLAITSLRPEVPEDLAIIIAKCLRTRPGDRYQTARALAADLDCFLEGRPIAARPYHWWERGLKWGQRRPAQATAAGLLAVLVVAALGGTGYHHWRQSETLRELAEEKTKGELVLREATAAAKTELRMKEQFREQLNLTPLMLLKLLDNFRELTEEHQLLLLQIRDALRRQAADLNASDPQVAEVVAKGLGALSYSEEFRFGLIEDAQADLDRSLDLTRRFPDSAPLRDLEAQMLLMRYRQGVRLGQSARAVETVDELRRLCDRLLAHPERPLEFDRMVQVVSTLHELGPAAAALPLVRRGIDQFTERLRQSANEPEDWGRLLGAQVLQARLEDQAEDFAGSDRTVEAWRRSLEEARRHHPGIDSSFAAVEFEFTLMRLARAGRQRDCGAVPGLWEEAHRQMAARGEQDSRVFVTALLQLRLLRTLLDLPAGWLDSGSLEQQVAQSLELAETAHRTQVERGVLQLQAQEIQRLWAGRSEAAQGALGAVAVPGTAPRAD